MYTRVIKLSTGSKNDVQNQVGNLVIFLEREGVDIVSLTSTLTHKTFVEYAPYQLHFHFTITFLGRVSWHIVHRSILPSILRTTLKIITFIKCKLYILNDKSSDK